MDAQNTDAALPATGRADEPAPLRAWHRLGETFAAVGTVLIGVLMLIICADILARNIWGASLPLVSEGGALLVVTLVALQLGATVRAGRLARTEVFILPFTERHPRAGAALEGLFDLTGAVVLGMIAWASLRVIEKDLNAAEFIGITGIATLPTWPFRALILAGFAVAAVEFAVRLIGAFRSMGGRA